MNKTPRRYAKVDEHTIKLIVEKEQIIDLANLLEAKKQLESQIADLQARSENINEIIAEAIKLKITPKVKEKDVEKKEK